MNKYKQVTEHHKKYHQKPNGVRRYDKKFKEFIIKEIAIRRNANLSWDQIAEEMYADYGIKDLSTFRKTYDVKKDEFDITINVDSDMEFTNIARARANLLKERKINVKQRNILHNDSHIIAYRQMLINAINNYKWKTYPIDKVKYDYNKVNKDSCVYIISDEHYRGTIDSKHLVNIFNSINKDIKENHIKTCELWFLGDGIDGLIHVGSLAQNDGAIIPSIQYINIISEMINKIKQVKKINYVNRSNHTQTRALGSKRNELAREDIGLMITAILNKSLRGDIEFNDDEVIMTHYNGKKIMLLHGHQSFAKSKNKLLDYLSGKNIEIPDMIYMGHWHQAKMNEFGNNKWLCVMPTCKNNERMSDYDLDNAFYNDPQLIRLKWNNKYPNFECLEVK